MLIFCADDSTSGRMARDNSNSSDKQRRRIGEGFVLTQLLFLILVFCSLLFMFIHSFATKWEKKESTLHAFLKESQQSLPKNQRNRVKNNAGLSNDTERSHGYRHSRGFVALGSSQPWKNVSASVTKETQKGNVDTQPQHRVQNDEPIRSALAGLNCDAHGGPSAEFAKEMVYWEDIPSDNRYVSIYKKHNDTQYLAFEADDAGFNNQRMALETLVALAIVTGRTLVLPPVLRIWNLEKNVSRLGNWQPDKFSFAEFYPYQAIAKEHVGLDVITMKEFLEREGLTGKLRDKNGTVSYAPEDRSDWDWAHLGGLKEWLREVTCSPMWNPDKCMLALPASTDPKDLQAMLDAETRIKNTTGFPKFDKYIGKPNPVNASFEERMKENWAEYWTGGKKLCVYDEEKQNARVLYFPNQFEMEARMLTHFYAFLFFQDWRQDLWTKRFIRDHMRYVDSFQCAAARVVRRLRERAKARGDPDGNFEALHIRRGDFTQQFKDSTSDASIIYDVSKDVLVENATVYIATDEGNRSFFDPLRKHYDLVFLEDFQDELRDLNTNFYGMIEQLVASRARSFFGCWLSSFTNYINRLRGYHANRMKAPGYEQGIIRSWYYYLNGEHRDDMRVFTPVYQGYYYREFPTSWRLIDTGVDMRK